MASVEVRKSSFGDENHLSAIFNELNQQRNTSRFCDVILRVCGEEIFAHSNVLAASSPYFTSFLGVGQDLPRAFSQKTPQIIEIHIDGSEGDSGYAEAVRRVVDYMYTSTIELNYKVLTPVIEIAKIMQMDRIMKFCDLFQMGEDGVVVPKVTPAPKVITRDISIQTLVSVYNLTGTHPYSTDEPPLPPGTIVRRKRGRPRKTEDLTTSETEDSKEQTAENDDKNESTGEVEGIKDEEVNDAPAEEELDQDDENSEDATNGRPIRKGRGKCPKYFENYVDSPIVSFNVNKSETGRDVYECQDCPYNSESIYHFRRHRSSHASANNNKYKCDRCDFATGKLKILTDHHRDHLHEDNQCSFCDFQASNKQSLNEHLEKHTGKYPYFCQFCETKFKTKTQLKLHLPKHLDDKPFVCVECNTGFKWKHALKNHMVTHSQRKDHLCDVCGFSTAHKGQLKAHRLIHTGNTFKCEVPGCTFQATKRQNLKYHMLTHTHEKPHQCEICGQSFSLLKNMKRHKLLHTDERPYSCKSCSFTTTRYDKLKDHMLMQHGEGEVPKKKFRLCDYPKSLIPGETIELEAVEQSGDSNIVHVENTMSTARCRLEDTTEGEQQIFITNPAGEPFPITLTRIENIDGIDPSCYQAIQLVAHVE